MPDYTKELSVAKDIAKKAGVIMLKYFHTDNEREDKADGSPVTIADKMINRMVIEEIGKHFDDVVIGEEESTGEYGMGRRWICDPIDGTKTYTWGVPLSTFALGLAVDGVPVLGVVGDPFLNKIYSAVKGQGAFCNEHPIHVSDKKINEGYVAVWGSAEKIIRDAGYMNHLTSKGAKLAAMSSGVYKVCMVAHGSFVGYWDDNVNPYDICGAQVILEEAGGKVTGLNGETLDYSKSFKGAIFSNGIVHGDLLEAAEKK
jgi:fructose-1,6-bisphosphatase/inositol monophosphatase family enzyme